MPAGVRNCWRFHHARGDSVLSRRHRNTVPSSSTGAVMRPSLRERAIAVCDSKIANKGDGVGLSFYAFFANKNDDPELLMEAARWWIETHELDHFVKAVVIRDMLTEGL